MIKYSKKLLKNFKLLKENSIKRKPCLVVLGINDKTYDNLCRIYSKRQNIESKYNSAHKWISLFNNGDDPFKIMSKFPEITSITILEKYFDNQFVALDIDRTLASTYNEFKEWFYKEYVEQKVSIDKIAEEHGYSTKALKCATNKLDIRRTRLDKPRTATESKSYVTIGRMPSEYLKNEKDVEVISKALSILIECNDPTEVSKRLNVSPRLAKRLHSDYNIFKANKIPYDKIIRLINENVLTIREINFELGLPKNIRFYVSNNIIVSYLIGKTIEEISIEENRKCVYPTMIGDRTYLSRVKSRPSVRELASMLKSNDPDFVSDLEKIKVIIECGDNEELILENLNITKEELNSLMTKYYIDEYRKGEY